MIMTAAMAIACVDKRGKSSAFMAVPQVLSKIIRAAVHGSAHRNRLRKHHRLLRWRIATDTGVSHPMTGIASEESVPQIRAGGVVVELLLEIAVLHDGENPDDAS